MHNIHNYRLWIGHSGDGRDLAAIQRAGIEVAVQVAMEEAPLNLSRELVSIRVPLLDGHENAQCDLRLAVDIVSRLMRDSRPTLVCCSAGMSRSPAIVACAMAALEARTPEECLLRLSEAMPVDVSPGLWEELVRVLGEIAGETW